MDDETKQEEQDKTPKNRNMTPLEMVAILLILVILGAISIETRIIISAFFLLGVVVLAGIVYALKVISEKTFHTITGLAFLSVIAFWIGWVFVKNWRVVPTPEYAEDVKYREYERYANRTVTLQEPPDFRITSGSFVIDGSTSLYDLYLSYANAVCAQSNLCRVMSNRTAKAYENLINGECDLVFAFKPSEAQIAEAANAGKKLKATPIGYDAFVFFVNADNPTNNLTVRQLKDIYAGNLTNWRQVGGEDATIIPFQRYENSGSQSRMERFMAGEKLLTPDKEHRFEFMSGIITHVARYRNYRYAIGYSFLYYVNIMMEGGGVKLLQVDGVEPTPKALRGGTYPLSEEICIVTTGNADPNVSRFIEWVLSPQGQAMMEAIGFVPIRQVPAGEDKPKTLIVAGKRHEINR